MKKLCISVVLLILIVGLYQASKDVCGRRETANIVLPPVEVEIVDEPVEIETIVETPTEDEPIEVESVEVIEPSKPVEDEVEEVNEIIEPTEPIEQIETKTSLGTFVLTAYCSCQQCCGQYALNRPLDGNGNPIVYTASGAIAQSGLTVAVDPTVIPYGSKVEINGHTYIAQDTGGAIKSNRIDVYFSDHAEALKFGRREAEVFLVKE